MGYGSFVRHPGAALWGGAACLLAALPACGNGDDDLDGGPSKPDVQVPDVGGEAFLFVNRIRTLVSRTFFVSVLPQLGEGVIDTSEALEVSAGLSRFRAFQGKVYVFRGEGGRVIRFGVEDDLSLVEEASFSMANEGIQEFLLSVAIINEQRAYYFDPAAAKVVVWNPETMSIESTFEVPETRREDLPLTVVGTPSIVGEFVVIPTSWRSRAQDDALPEVGMVVLSADRNELVAVLTDRRCGVSTTGFVLDGAYYILGDWFSGVLDVFAPEGTDLPPPCLLRWQPSSPGEFDPDFRIDMRALTGAPQFDGAFGTADGKFVTRVYDASFADDEIPNMVADPRDYFNLELWRWAVVDLEAETVERIDTLPLTGTSFNPSVVDGDFLVPQLDEDTQTSELVVIDAAAAATEAALRAEGDIIDVERIR